MYEVTLIVNEQLLEGISLKVKSYIPIIQLNNDNYIDIVRGSLLFQEGHVLMLPSNVYRVRNGYLYRAG